MVVVSSSDGSDASHVAMADVEALRGVDVKSLSSSSAPSLAGVVVVVVIVVDVVVGGAFGGAVVKSGNGKMSLVVKRTAGKLAVASGCSFAGTENASSDFGRRVLGLLIALALAIAPGASTRNLGERATKLVGRSAESVAFSFCLPPPPLLRLGASVVVRVVVGASVVVRVVVGASVVATFGRFLESTGQRA